MRARAIVVAVALLVAAACDGSQPNVRARSALPGEVIAGSRPTGAAAPLGVARRVRVGDVDLAYREFGSGPPLVLIAGQGSAMNVWGYRLPHLLSERFRVLMFDNRGVGWSTDGRRDPLTIQRMADDTAGLLRALSISRADIVGWSTGGEIALALAVRHPSVVASLVLSGATAGGRSAVQAPRRVDALVNSRDLHSASILLTHYLFPPSAKAAAAAYVRDFLSVPAEPVSAQILRRQAGAERRFARSENVYTRLRDIAAPVLVTNGALDRLVPPENARIIAQRLRRGRLELFRDAAHAMMFQARARFVRDLESFVEHPPHVTRR